MSTCIDNIDNKADFGKLNYLPTLTGGGEAYPPPALPLGDNDSFVLQGASYILLPRLVKKKLFFFKANLFCIYGRSVHLPLIDSLIRFILISLLIIRFIAF